MRGLIRSQSFEKRHRRNSGFWALMYQPPVIKVVIRVDGSCRRSGFKYRVENSPTLLYFEPGGKKNMSGDSNAALPEPTNPRTPPGLQGRGNGEDSDDFAGKRVGTVWGPLCCARLRKALTPLPRPREWGNPGIFSGALWHPPPCGNHQSPRPSNLSHPPPSLPLELPDPPPIIIQHPPTNNLEGLPACRPPLIPTSQDGPGVSLRIPTPPGRPLLRPDLTSTSDPNPISFLFEPPGEGVQPGPPGPPKVPLTRGGGLGDSEIRVNKTACIQPWVGLG